jgi:hypothetical protein
LNERRNLQLFVEFNNIIDKFESWEAASWEKHLVI